MRILPISIWNYAATSVAPQDEVITVKFDPDAITAYNATLSNPLDHFIAFPDSIFSFTPGSFTVQKGNNFTDNIPFIVFPSKIDPKVNYMYPITITTAPAGSTIATNHMTLYYHLIGNPIAGCIHRQLATMECYRLFHPAPPSLTATIGVLFAPINGTSVSIPVIIRASTTSYHLIMMELVILAIFQCLLMLPTLLMRGLLPVRRH